MLSASPRRGAASVLAGKIVQGQDFIAIDLLRGIDIRSGKEDQLGLTYHTPVGLAGAEVATLKQLTLMKIIKTEPRAPWV